jgi:chemotaxis protein CheZ
MSAENLSRADDASTTTTLAIPGAADYAAIFAAVMETDRGRWFLAEYARRNRHADTVEVLAAIERLAAMARPTVAGLREDKAPRGESVADLDRLRAELADMANAIARTKNEIASIRPDDAQGGRIMEATEQLDSVLKTTERATSDILAAAEQVQEVAWTMREQGMESEFCDRLDSYATEIYTACSFQDLTGQRTRKIIHVLRYLEARIQAMSGMWGAASPAKSASAAAGDPAAASVDLSQHDLDRLLAPAPAVPDAVPAVEPPKVETTVETKHIASLAPTTVATTVAKPALTIEGPMGSFSILPGRAAQPQAPHPTKAPDPAPPAVNPDPLVAGLRAFAANLMSEYGKIPSVPDGKPPSVTVAAARPTAPAATTVATAAPDPRTEFALPLTVAPSLGDLPQRPAPKPTPPLRKSDISEDLFADVMALTDEERIALFT